MPKTTTKEKTTINLTERNWLFEFIANKNNVSNVALFSTLDPRRYDEFTDWVMRADVQRELNNQGEISILEYNVQTKQVGRLVREDNEISVVPEDIDGDLGPWLDRQLKQQSTLLIIKWIMSPADANDERVGYLMEWSKNREVRIKRSGVAVFTFYASFFHPTTRRWCHTINVPTASEEEIRQKLEGIANDFRTTATNEQWPKNWDQISQDTVEALRGLTVDDVVSATKLSLWSEKRYNNAYFTQKKIQILEDYGIRYIKPTYGFEKVGGMNRLKTTIINRFIKPLKNPQRAKEFNLSPARGLLLYGLPGCGKTHTCYALAKELDVAVLEVDPSDFLRGIVGESEQRTRIVLEAIESVSPAVVVMDEFDVLTSHMDSMNTTNDVTRNIQLILLKWLNDPNRKSFVIGGTNHAERIHPAFIRPKRIDTTLLILPPNFEARQEILKIHTTGMPLDVGDHEVFFKEIASKTAMWTPAELEKLCQEAAAIAAFDTDSKAVNDQHFGYAWRIQEIDRTGRTKQVQGYIENYKHLLNSDKRFLKDAINDMADKDDRNDPEMQKILTAQDLITDI